MRRLILTTAAALALGLAPAAHADAPTPEEHAQCVAAFGEAYCDALEADLTAIDTSATPPPAPPPPPPPPPAPPAPLTPAEEHAQCVAAFDEATCHDLECEQWFGIDGCPPSGFHASDEPPVPRLSIAQARRSLRHLFVADLNAVWLRTRIVGCHRTSRLRVDCGLVLRVRGAVCRSPAHVIATREEYIATVRGFRCRPTKRRRAR